MLTEKGRDLAPIVIALTDWGDKLAAPNGPPIVYTRIGCGGEVSAATACGRCGRCGRNVQLDAIEAQPGLGSRH